MVADLAVPSVLVTLGSPYSAAAFPQVSTILSVYGSSAPLQRAAARAILGATPVSGQLPVQVPGVVPVGHGQVRPRLDATLQTAVAGHDEEVDVPPVDLADARGALRRAVDARAFPGAVYAVGWRNHLVDLGSTGHMSYASGASPMRPDALFDVASMTKVVATTTVAMMAVERGYLRLDYAVESLVPEFAGPGKSDVTIAHLLTHTSGLPAYVEFFRDYVPEEAGEGPKREILERIYGTSLEAPPGSRYAYSDLGIILLGEVLDRALGEPYARFAEREVFRPLGMSDTGWNPPARERPRIPPTERDPWRARLVAGEVHDENAFVMGGVAPHAGLFSTATDLAIFAQTMLDLGTYDHRRILQRSTVVRWRRRQGIVSDSSRALGWDTAFDSDRWGMFSPQAHGHTGFTGTSIWIDPARELFVILLTNRVHPTRENSRHIQARIDFHTAVVDAIDAARRR